MRGESFPLVRKELRAPYSIATKRNCVLPRLFSRLRSRLLRFAYKRKGFRFPLFRFSPFYFSISMKPGTL